MAAPTKYSLLLMVLIVLASSYFTPADSRALRGEQRQSRQSSGSIKGTSSHSSSRILPLGRNKPKSSAATQQAAAFASGDSANVKTNTVTSSSDKQLRKLQVSLISAYIKRGKVSEAERIFDDELTQPASLSAESDRMICQLFNDAYDNNIDNVDHLLSFEMSRVDQFSVGYETLFDGLKRNGQLHTPQAVHLASLSDYLMNLTSEFVKLPRRYKDRFQRVRSGIEDPVQKMINLWAKKILALDYQFIVEYLGEIPTAAYVVKRLVPAVLVERVENVDKLLEFIRDVPSISATVAGVSELYTVVENLKPGFFNKIENTRHNVALSYIVEETMSYADYPFIPQEERSKLEAVRDALWPKKVEEVISTSSAPIDVNEDVSVSTPSSNDNISENHATLPAGVDDAFLPAVDPAATAVKFTEDPAHHPSKI